MAENFRYENGLLLSPGSLVEFRDGCTETKHFIEADLEAGEQAPCPDCSGEHEVAEAISLPIAHNITFTEVEPEDEPSA
ncbi:hypothetical protein Psed_6840 (plasmid) [Pseudonocardia dioxanivorans CB1190]|uniref:Uncharacterized protein n=1 Tax=Pseudonocardia dioxanivorans (strain ATCC 55486 / DSM 44775 / JCM 13855 / CB1190) TaxID=675635 RepID=F2L6L7_PSEUX|nr:hypothetical protein [Pseudonocardia dioxanivorans]AEA28911.1 hypothetical protein Psed_6840 [Pseudonocardia dioxanivorans CB1190]